MSPCYWKENPYVSYRLGTDPEPITARVESGKRLVHKQNFEPQLSTTI
jgi:hypothetical protein